MSRPFDDISALLADLPGPDEDAGRRTLERVREQERAAGDLGRLGAIAVWLSRWTGRAPPQVTRPVIAVYAGGNAVADRLDGGAAPLGARERMERMAAGAAAVNAAAQLQGAGLDVFDLAVDRPVPDITRQPAMNERACAATVAFGMEALAKSPDLLIVEAIGAGSGLAAGALTHALAGGDAFDWTGPRSAEVIVAAVARARGQGLDGPLEALRQLGGREIAAAAGAILAARVQRTPVLLDGYAAAAGAAVLQAVEPRAIDHCLAAHVTTAPGHRRLLDRLELEPLLDLGLASGDGVGAATAMALVRTACAVHAGAEPG